MTFDEWYQIECEIDAAEMVGPNAHEFWGLVERLVEGKTRREAAMTRYTMETGNGKPS
jgi:hypothetical protein